MSRIVKDTLRLVAITLIAGVLLSVVYSVTKDTIAAAKEEERQASYREVFPQAASFEAVEGKCPAELSGGNVTLNAALYAKDENGADIGCVLSLTSHEGYAGDIVLSLGISQTGEITGVKVTQMSETSGLGANCQNEDWISQFKGINSGSVKFTKTGKTAPDEIDAISGATFTTRAVTNAVNAGIEFVSSDLGIIASETEAE